MPEVTSFISPTEWKIAPINKIDFIVATESELIEDHGMPALTSAHYTITTLEEGSKFTLTPVTSIDDRGLPRAVAYKFEGTFIGIQTNYHDIMPMLRKIAFGTISDVAITMQPLAGQVHGVYIWFGGTSSVNTTFTPERAAFVADWSGTWKVLEEKESPRFEITLTGLFSLDIAQFILDNYTYSI